MHIFVLDFDAGTGDGYLAVRMVVEDGKIKFRVPTFPTSRDELIKAVTNGENIVITVQNGIVDLFFPHEVTEVDMADYPEFEDK